MLLTSVRIWIVAQVAKLVAERGKNEYVQDALIGWPETSPTEYVLGRAKGLDGQIQADKLYLDVLCTNHIYLLHQNGVTAKLTGSNMVERDFWDVLWPIMEKHLGLKFVYKTQEDKNGWWNQIFEVTQNPTST